MVYFEDPIPKVNFMKSKFYETCIMKFIQQLEQFKK